MFKSDYNHLVKETDYKPLVKESDYSPSKESKLKIKFYYRSFKLKKQSDYKGLSFSKVIIGLDFLKVITRAFKSKSDYKTYIVKGLDYIRVITCLSKGYCCILKVITSYKTKEVITEPLALKVITSLSVSKGS